MTEQKEPHPWHICKDCIDPLADWLQEMVRHWDHIGVERPEPQDIRWKYEACKVDFAANWMKLCISADYAKDFENALHGPLQDYQRLYFRAMQILDGDLDGTSQNATRRPDPIRQAMLQRYPVVREQCREMSEAEEESFRENDPILRELEDPDTLVRQRFEKTVKYLRQVSVLIGGKIQEKQGEQLPPRLPNIRLSETEEDIVNVISEAGQRMTQTKIFNSLSAKAKIPSEGTTKINLAAMVRHGILTHDPKAKPSGYGLPEWDD